MPSPMLRLGIIGTGCIGMEHLRNALLLSNVQLVAIADPHEPSRHTALTTLGEQGLTEVAVYEHGSELLRQPSVDAVVVCTPNDTHHALMRLVLASGKHCLIEKPLCTLISHSAETVALAAHRSSEAGAAAPLLWCGMEYRYIPAIARLIREADEGIIGDLCMLSIREHRFPFLRKVGNWNRRNERTGGTLVEKCVHFFDLMRRILRSEPTRIFGSGGRGVNHMEVPADGSPVCIPFPFHHHHAQPKAPSCPAAKVSWLPGISPTHGLSPAAAESSTPTYGIPRFTPRAPPPPQTTYLS
jgi:predicted dehydrogenase